MKGMFDWKREALRELYYIGPAEPPKPAEPDPLLMAAALLDVWRRELLLCLVRRAVCFSNEGERCRLGSFYARARINGPGRPSARKLAARQFLWLELDICCAAALGGCTC